jgi:hypothetical protein
MAGGESRGDLRNAYVQIARMLHAMADRDIREELIRARTKRLTQVRTSSGLAIVGQIGRLSPSK